MNTLSIKSMSNQISKKKKKGFTLVELIIVIAIIAILAAMAIPKFSSVRTDAKVSNDVAACKNIQSQIAIGIANDSIKKTTEAKEVPEDILSKLDGKAEPQAMSGKKFKYEVDDKDNIKVYIDSYQLYPDITKDGKTTRQIYAEAAAK
ncbi:MULTISPECIES: prepilin-type N-terminal cleavage/methylation domain-containing protein [unclassified Clostridium]|uniref:prepilin-type N-terminal cleavage/methylation domain-containing protein n=1 Tax=unclassified Clostridium TaxID=2614128 RepID=UPI00257AC37D|nr:MULTISPECIES: prepilin-type N-terminal cleavage/methylation domain-containing protein [unclassified Clostridium]